MRVSFLLLSFLSLYVALNTHINACHTSLFYETEICEIGEEYCQTEEE